MLFVAAFFVLGAEGASAAIPPHPISVNFQEKFNGFNLGGVGEVVPRIVPAKPHGTNKVCRFVLEGEAERSELTLGGDGTYNADDTFKFVEGSEYWYAFSFNIKEMDWGFPGAHNVLMQFHPNGDGDPAFALGMWDVDGERGLWSEGPAMDGSRFLAPLKLNFWHRIELHFKSSQYGRGFYQLYLDGRLIDARRGVSMIVSGKAYGFIKDGLYRNHEVLHGRSVLLFDSAELSKTRPD